METWCLSSFMSKPGKVLWIAVKRVFRFLYGTSEYGLCTRGYVFNLFRGGVSGMSIKQYIVTLSTTEAEYMVATHASKEAVWL